MFFDSRSSTAKESDIAWRRRSSILLRTTYIHITKLYMTSYSFLGSQCAIVQLQQATFLASQLNTVNCSGERHGTREEDRSPWKVPGSQGEGERSLFSAVLCPVTTNPNVVLNLCNTHSTHQQSKRIMLSRTAFSSLSRRVVATTAPRAAFTTVNQVKTATDAAKFSGYQSIDFTIKDSAPVYEAVQKFAAFNIGCLVTTDGAGTCLTE